MNKLLAYDIINLVSYNFNSQNSCSESGCEQEGICRCTVITNPSIRKINFKGFVDSIYELYFDKGLSTKRNSKINTILWGVTEEVDKYTIDRILRINKIWQKKSWNFQIIEGYYGQEIDQIILNEKVSELINYQILEAINLYDLKSRVEYLLKLEYGKLLPELQNKNWEVIEIDKSKITFGSKSHLKKVSNKNLIHYSDKYYNLVRGVVIKNDDSYRLIDGYHRCFTTDKNSVRVLLAT